MSDEGRLVTLEQGQARQRECLQELRAKVEDYERRIAALEAQASELSAVVKASNHAHTAKAAELEASLCEARAHVRASNMQKPRAVRE